MIHVPAEKYSSFVPITGELFNPLEGWNIISKKKIKLIEEGGNIDGYYLHLINFKQIIEDYEIKSPTWIKIISKDDSIADKCDITGTKLSYLFFYDITI